MQMESVCNKYILKSHVYIYDDEKAEIRHLFGLLYSCISLKLFTLPHETLGGSNL